MPNRAIITTGPDDGINLGVGEHQLSEVVTARFDRPAADAVAELKKRLAKSKSKLDRLEFHCHGKPAQLLLGSDTVHLGNVQLFGQLLRDLFQPNGSIELLACQVASPRFRVDLNLQFQPPPGQPQSFLDCLHARTATELSAKLTPEFLARHEKDLAAGNFKFDDPITTGVPLSGFYDYFEQERLKMLQIVGTRWPKVQDALRPNTHVKVDSGPAFCRTLAMAANVTVRAAAFSQKEEGHSNFWGIISLIGDWEGPVWDFLPNGSCKYLGENIPHTLG